MTSPFRRVPQDCNPKVIEAAHEIYQSMYDFAYKKGYKDGYNEAMSEQSIAHGGIGCITVTTK